MRQQPGFRRKISEDAGVELSFDHDFESLRKAVSLQEFDVAPNSRMREELGANEEGRTIMPHSAHNQPLGVLVAEKAKVKNIPYVIVTSGHGGHGDISTPIAVYLKEKGLIESYRGNFVDYNIANYSHNGKVVPFEEFEANELPRYLDPRVTDQEVHNYLRSQYEDLKEDIKNDKLTTTQFFITDARKNRPEEWRNIIRGMEYVVYKFGEKTLPTQ